MDAGEVRDELKTRMMDLDGEEFEQLCKIIVEEIEHPPEIELTPFGGDGGIDVRGHYGESFFNTRFGVQSKRYSDNVGSRNMRDFVGALDTHGYQFGSFVTTAGFTQGAEDAAEEATAEIVLIDGDRLADIMVVHEIGVRYDESDYRIDHSFWEIFEDDEEDDRIATIKIPQADSLSVIHTVLEAIDEGNRFKPEIKQYLEENTNDKEWTPRQADYYPAAAYTLGFVHKDRKGEYEGRKMRMWGLTRDGEEYMRLVRSGNKEDRKEYLQDSIRDAEIFQRVLERLRSEGSIDHGDLFNIIHTESKLNDTTAKRRRATVGKWLGELPEVARVKVGNSYRYDYVGQGMSDYAS